MSDLDFNPEKYKRFKWEGYINDDFADVAWEEAKSDLSTWYKIQFDIEKNFNFLKIDNSINDWLREARYLEYWENKYHIRKANWIDYELSLESFISSCSSTFPGITNEIRKLAQADVLDLEIGEIIYDFYEQNEKGGKFHLLYIFEEAANAINTPKLKLELLNYRNAKMVEEKKFNSELTPSLPKKPRDKTGSKSNVTDIQWKRKLSLLAYLFHRLKEAEIIQGEHLASALSTIFIDKNYMPIDNKILNKYFSDFRNNLVKPHDSNQIDELITLLITLDQKL